ncbi:OLC1v1003079C1 [Oldenlandia corymbosa var. corymbosa]|uniref:OLC1v1003079C1 n=1 Tax=Oldenlandia corymbosa var. corymbosa TaxID=529605 RepID=A0AAV1D998_OLDCO|nr:OLC1v1003079C1 [Oldenlandia corymbosa var. corymbosa]
MATDYFTEPLNPTKRKKPFTAKLGFMARLSPTGIRCLLIVVVFSLVGCFLLLRPKTKTIPKSVILPVMKIQMPIPEYGGLHEVEKLEIPTLSKRQATKTTSLVDEFLDRDSQVRSFFFPDVRNAVDPRKKRQKFNYYPGRIWLDTDGKPIQAHGGGIMYDEMLGKYYWYGEYKDGPTYRVNGNRTARVDIIGVGCYSSEDLWTWKNEGIVLKAEEQDQNHDLYKSNVLERPKVIYNEGTGTYVMWMHIDNANYSKAAIGIAVSDFPTGPFRYLYSIKPHRFESRDMTVFKDDKYCKAYLYYSSMRNKEIHISPLREDFLHVSNVVKKVLIGQYREAPAVFKHKGLYYMITSGCSGWAPNEALAHVAESPMGPWETIGNPCVGANQDFRATTFFAQGTFVLPMPKGPHGSFIFMADRWKPDDLGDSRYLWLPLYVDEAGYQPLHNVSRRPQVLIFWHERWRMPSKVGGN